MSDDTQVDLIKKFIKSRLPGDFIFAIEASLAQLANFQQLTALVRGLLSLLGFGSGNPSRVALMLLTSSPTVGAFESNREAIIQNLLNLSHAPGAACNHGAAFTLAINTARSHARPGVNSCIVFLTATNPNGVTPAILTALTSSNLLPLILGVGLGITPAITSIQTATTAGYVPLSDWNQVTRITALVNTVPAAPPEAEVLSRTTTSAIIGITATERASLFAAKYATNGTNWSVPTESDYPRIELKGLRPGTKYNVITQMKLASGVWSDYSLPISLETLTRSQLHDLLHNRIELKKEEDRLRNYIQLYGLPNHLRHFGLYSLNILFLGRIGQGKSCMLTGIYSALEGKYKPVTLHTNRGSTATNEMTSFPINEAKTVNLYDTYGWNTDGSNYKNLLKQIINGNIRPGFVENGETATHFNSHPTIADAIHAVVIVVELRSTQVDPEMERLQIFFNELFDLKIQPLVVLTKLDLSAKDYAVKKSNLEDICDNQDVQEGIARLCQATSIRPAAVFPLVNYTGQEDFPNPVINFLLLRILQSAIDTAESKIEKALGNTLFLTTEAGAILHQVTVPEGLNISLTALRATMDPQKSQTIQFRNTLTKQIIPRAEEAQRRAADCRTESAEKKMIRILVENAAGAAVPPPVVGSQMPNAVYPKVVIFDQTSEKVLGFLPQVPQNSTLATFRQKVKASFDADPYSGGYKFLQGTEDILSSDEGSKFLRDCVVVKETKTMVNIAKDEGIKVSILSQASKQSLGFVRGVFPTDSLSDIRVAINNSLSVGDGYQFYDKEEDPINPSQEADLRLKDLLIKREGKTVIYISK